MSQGNIGLFLQAMEAINRGDAEALIRLSDEEVEVFALRSSIEGPYRGHEGVRRFFADNAENFARFEVSYPDIRDLGDRVLAIGTVHVQGRAGGVQTEVLSAGVATSRAGKLLRWEDFGDRQMALEVVGLAE